MMFSKEDDQIVVFYEEDGSKWIYAGFVIKNGVRFMQVFAHPETLREDPNLRKQIIDVHLGRDDYENIIESIQTICGKHWQPNC